MQLPAQETIAPNGSLHSVFRIPLRNSASLSPPSNTCTSQIGHRYNGEKMSQWRTGKARIIQKDRKSNNLTVPHHHNGPILHPISLSAIQSFHAISFSPSKPSLVHSEKKQTGGQLEDPKASWRGHVWPYVATCGHHITMGKASLIETVSKFGSQIQECKVLLLQQLICQNSCSEMRSYLLPSFAESDRDRSISRVATRAVCESPRKNGAKCPAGNMNMQFSEKITTNCNS